MYTSLSRTAIILTVNPNSVATADGTTAYGYVGGPSTMWTGGDSGAQGIPWALSKEWLFQAVQIGSTAPTGYTVTLYGTNDTRILLTKTAIKRTSAYELQTVQGQAKSMQSELPVGLGDVSLPSNSWIPLPSLPDQGAVGVLDANPITAVGQCLHVKRPLLAVRAVLTVLGGGAAGSMGICVTAV